MLQNFVIRWKISSLQNQIKRRRRERQDVKPLRAQIAELNRKKSS